MAYRDERIALEAEHEAITTELSARGTLPLARRLAVIEERMAASRLSVLDEIEIASPCAARWEAMEGDGPVRHCHTCDKPVYDLSGMSASSAVALLSQAGDVTCMRLHRRRDGTVITADCAEGRSARNHKGLLLGIGSALAAVATVVAMGPSFDAPCEIDGPTPPLPEEVVMGEAPPLDALERIPRPFDEQRFLYGWPKHERVDVLIGSRGEPGFPPWESSEEE